MAEWIWTGPGECVCPDRALRHYYQVTRNAGLTSFECDHGIWNGVQVNDSVGVNNGSLIRTTVQKDGAAPTECTPTGPTPRDRAGCGGVGCPCSDDCYTTKENQP